jgi:hypothetical protein
VLYDASARGITEFLAVAVLTGPREMRRAC